MPTISFDSFLKWMDTIHWLLTPPPPWNQYIALCSVIILYCLIQYGKSDDMKKDK